MLAVSARHHDVTAVEVAAAPLDGAGHDRAAVGHAARDARAGVGLQGGGKNGRKREDDDLFHSVGFI